VVSQIHPTALDELKDAYSLEFLSLPADHGERDLHAALLRYLGRFIAELGRDFCFVGSEYPVQVGNQDFAIDLVFFHRALCCLVGEYQAAPPARALLRKKLHELYAELASDEDEQLSSK
jgi:predicted nuclease of restriction endonuclease-like (RecB) superfamily